MAKKRKATSDSASETTVDFETALGEVEEIVQELESGDAGLTQSLAHYEKGIQRLKQCHELLQNAERRITLLSGFDADGNPVTEPFDEDESDNQEAKRKSRSTRSRREGATASRKKPAKGASAQIEEPTETGDRQSSVDDSLGLF